MNFTGTELIHKRNFFTQTGNLGVSAECAINADTGIFYVGISGSVGTLEWKLFNGKILYGDRFVGSYQPYQSFLFDIQTTTGHLNNKINNIPVYYGQSRATGYFDYVYFRREDPTLGADFQFNVSGNNSPLYTVSSLGYLTSSGQSGVTGYFIDQSLFPIQVFNSATYNPQNLDFSPLITTINGGGTGTFSYNGDFTTFDFTQPILTTFNTNFGDLSIIFSIVNIASYNTFILFSPTITDFTFNTGNILNRTLSYLNYSGGQTTNNFNTNLFFSLAFMNGQSGTPGWTGGILTGAFSGQGSGIVSGIGYTGIASGGMTGLLTGYDYAGSGQFSVNEWTTGYGMPSIITLGGASGYATGYLDITNLQPFNISGAGGELLFGVIKNGDYTQIANSGKPQIYGSSPPLPFPPLSFPNATQLIQNISGDPNGFGVNGIIQGGFIYFTAITGGSVGNTIGILAASLQVEQPGYITGTNFASGIFAGQNLYGGGTGITGTSIQLTGGVDGGGTTTVYPISNYTGIINQSLSGIYVTGLSSIGGFTGNWDVLTGVDSSSLYSIKTLGNYTATMISGSGIFPPNSSMSFQLSHLSTGHDTVQLIISGAQVINPINQQLYN